MAATLRNGQRFGPFSQVMVRFVLLLILVTACTGSASTNASPSRTQTTRGAATQVPTRSSVLAVVTGTSGIKWSVALAGTDGAVVAQAIVDQPIIQPNAAAPWTSTSSTRLYYLNAKTEVRFLDPDGTTGLVTHIPSGDYDTSTFAVSPDDKRIAVSILGYAPPGEWTNSFPKYTGTHMYVEDLVGRGHHVDIFDSTSVVEFPIGWTGGQLVVAVSTIACCTRILINPYNASAYHVADPETGKRLASLCENSSGPLGPPEPAGAICWHDQGSPTFQRWDGTPFPAPAAVPSPDPNLIAMSPDGRRVAVGGDRIRIMGNGPDDLLSESGYVVGWLDANHIVFERPALRLLSVFDLNGRRGADWPAAWVAWVYRGSLPTALS